MKVKPSYKLAGLIASIAAIWVLSGVLPWPEGGLPASLKGDASAGAVVSASAAATRAAARADAETDAGADLVRVRVRTLTAQETTAELIAHGKTEAERHVTVRAEVAGKVVEILPRKGALVRAGEPLVRLDAKDRPQRLREAEALVAQRELEFEQARKLAAKSYASRSRVAEAEALLRTAQAERAAIREEIEDSVITAPFDGVFNDHEVEVGDVVGVGDNVAEVIDLDPMTISAQVSEREVGRVAVGNATEVRLVDGRTRTGTVTWVSRVADPQTRTFTVEVAVPNPAADIPEGMTAELRLALDRRTAHLVSPAVLTLNDAGTVGVKLVDANDRVVFRAAELLSDGPDGMWLGGLPRTARLITAGQEYVKPGQKVMPVPESAISGTPAGAGQAQVSAPKVSTPKVSTQ